MGRFVTSDIGQMRVEEGGARVGHQLGCGSGQLTMATCGGRKWLALLVGLATFLVGNVPLSTSAAATASAVGRLVLSQELGRDFDGVFPCPCGWDACRNPAPQGLGKVVLLVATNTQSSASNPQMLPVLRHL